MIEQSKSDEESHNRRLDRQKFYLELTQKEKYDEPFLRRSKSYEFDLAKKCTVLIVDGDLENNNSKIHYQKYHHYVEVNERILFFVTEVKIIDSLLDELKADPSITKISVGTRESVAALSLKNAQLALEVGSKIRPLAKLYRYEELRLLINISHPNKEFFGTVVANLDQSGNKLELIQTLQVYIEENGDSNQIAKRLNIHRNTLSYRLERIRQLTGRNPKHLLELFELLCGLAWKP